MSPLAVKLVQFLTLAANELEEAARAEKMFMYAGVLRSAAKLVPQVDNGYPDDPERCPGCGGSLPSYAGRGRPRTWCSERCRDRYRRPGSAR